MFFERPGMRCPKNIESFLWIFRYEGYHDFEIVSGTLRRWGAREWQKWQFNWRCKACGARGHEFGVDDTHIRRMMDAELVQAGEGR